MAAASGKCLACTSRVFELSRLAFAKLILFQFHAAHGDKEEKKVCQGTIEMAC